MTETERKLLLKLAQLVIDEVEEAIFEYDKRTAAKELRRDLIDMKDIIELEDGKE